MPHSGSKAIVTIVIHLNRISILFFFLDNRMGAQISKRFQTLERDCKKPSSKRSKRSKESHSQEVSIKDQEIRGHDQAYSHIETLPRELIWMIMEYAPAVLLELAVVSKIEILKRNKRLVL